MGKPEGDRYHYDCALCRLFLPSAASWTAHLCGALQDGLTPSWPEWGIAERSSDCDRVPDSNHREQVLRLTPGSFVPGCLFSKPWLTRITVKSLYSTHRLSKLLGSASANVLKGCVSRVSSTPIGYWCGKDAKVFARRADTFHLKFVLYILKGTSVSFLIYLPGDFSARKYAIACGGYRI
jgi:hypothetical protein